MTPSAQPTSALQARVVVVGAGHAAATMVGLLRQAGHIGDLILIGDEAEPPYHRPPLSKSFDTEHLEDWLRHPDFYSDQQICTRFGERVIGIERTERLVTTSAGHQHHYDALVLATGARPRSLPVPGADLDGVTGLRSLADARKLRRWLHEERNILVVGGGYIGLEVAAVVRSAHRQVIVLEREDRVLARVASPEFSSIISRHHERAGTTIITGVDVKAFTGDQGRVRAAVLSDGTEIPCEAVLVGIGAVPNDELASVAGLHCSATGGIVVDGSARTSDPRIYAMGDVTVRPVGGLSEPRRLESIPSATEQARQVVAAIVGTAPPRSETPWFWSDQFDLKLKIAGVVQPGADTVLRGDPSSGRFAIYHHHGGVVTAVESSNAPQEFMAGRKWIAAGARVDPTRLAHLDVPLKELVTESV